MQQLISLWTALSPRRRLVVGVATFAVFVAVLLLARAASTPGMALLYSGLEPGASGEVVQALEQRGIAYEVRGDSIHVDAGERDRARMMLAADGLPAPTTQGYELLDGLSGFGTTSQMFDAAYWRAKEGELARTISASAGIETARVHIARGNDRPFARQVSPSASVAVTTIDGALSERRGRALRVLVAAAVSGLDPADVAVTRGDGTLVAGDGDIQTGANGKRAEELRRRVERLLAAHLGPGKAVVEASVETSGETEAITERRIDPESRVAISSITEESSRNAREGGGEGVTVASNLPDGEADSDAQGSRSQDTETRERVNFEVSETRREVNRAPGGVRRITVAALVGGRREVAADGTETWSPRPQDELDALRELIAAAVGYDAERGDQITLRSLPLETPAPQGTEPAAPGLLDGLRLDPMALIRLVALAIVALVLGLFVIRPILMAAHASGPRLAGPELQIESGNVTENFAGPPADADAPDPEGFGVADFSTSLPVIGQDTTDTEDDPSDPVARLRRLMDSRQDEAVEILRGWMEDKEEKA